jgi:hypothetical protein
MNACMCACVHARVYGRLRHVMCRSGVARMAYSDVRLGFAQNAAGTAPVSVLFSRLIFVTAGRKAIESGMVPTKRFCWKRLHRNMRESSSVSRPSLCEPDALRQRLDRNKRCRREERAALHAIEVNELADRWMNRPVERVPRQGAARTPEAQVPSRHRRKAPLCFISAHYGDGRPGALRNLQQAASKPVPRQGVPEYRNRCHAPPSKE